MGVFKSYNGAAWLTTFDGNVKAYDVSTWRTCVKCSAREPSAWRLIHTDDPSVSNCDWTKNAGSCSAPTCTQETHNVTWTVVHCNFSIHHIGVYSSENGGSFGWEEDNECASSATVNVGHYQLKFSHTDSYAYKVEIHLDSDHSVLSSSTSSTKNSIGHERCSVCVGA